MFDYEKKTSGFPHFSVIAAYQRNTFTIEIVEIMTLSVKLVDYSVYLKRFVARRRTYSESVFVCLVVELWVLRCDVTHNLCKNK